jgi:hypothetical protein
MLPGFPVPILGIVVLTAGPILSVALDSYFFENESLEFVDNLG